MYLSKPFHSRFVLACLFFASFSAAIAQSDTGPQFEPSYEVSLHVVIGSNDGASRSDTPPSLAPVIKHLKGNFSFSSYRLANTFLGRISNNGNFEYKSVSNILGQEIDADAPTFLEWSLGPFRSVQNGFQARGFRFGARIPIRSGARKESSDGANPINYEAVGMTMNLIGLPANEPTLIGTISLPRTAGTLFLIATVKNAEY